MTGLKRKNGLPLREKSLRHRWDWKVQRPGLSPASTKMVTAFSAAPVRAAKLPEPAVLEAVPPAI
jgi:hypothetical protein